MSLAPLVFLDANIVFSAALGGPSFALLIELGTIGRLRLVTSAACEREARVNLQRKAADRVAELDRALRVVEVHDPDAEPHRAWAEALVHHRDVHVLAIARALEAAVLVTGDRAHFGPLMVRDDLPIRVRTVRDLLLEGPMSPPQRSRSAR